MNPVLANLVDTAWHLAAIQIEGVEDYCGFSNADKNVGAHLASVVSADPSDEASVVALASLVGVKYQRQTLGIVGSEVLAQFKSLAKGGKLTPEQRDAARKTVILQSHVHEKFGSRFLLSFQFSQDFAYSVKQNGGRAFHGPDGWKWAVKPENIEATVADLKAHGARIIGTLDAPDVAPAKRQQRAIQARLEGKRVILTFGYDRGLVDAIKAVSSRRYDMLSKEWSIPARELTVAIENLRLVGDDVDLTELRSLVSLVPQTARPVDVEEPEILVDERLLTPAKDYQREGVNWLVGPLNEARKEVLNGATLRGKILGDKMGLGKTLQVEVASKAILDSVKPDGRVLVIAPATAKINWEREIHKYCGPDEVVNIVGDKTAPSASARWNIVNYDILKQWYMELVKMGFDILIIDEAHYIKNRDAERSRLVVGGSVSFPETLSPAQTAKLRANHQRIVAEAEKAHKLEMASRIAKGDLQITKFKAPKMKWPHKVRRIDGLAAEATMRVFPLTGTPLANRPKDLFNLLRAVGHPLGRNFREFAMRYCDPQVGFRGSHTYNGSSNLEELRERIDSIFLQRFEVPGLPPLIRNWLPVEVDLKAYLGVMSEYEEKRKAGLLSSIESHLALISEARMCAAIAKIPATISRTEDALEQGEKVLVFSLYTKCIQKIKEHFGDAAVVLDGSKTQKQRQDAIDRFQTDPSVKVFIGQTIAAGVAITLTAATQVKFNDLDWVPANLLQAEKRPHRIGQTSVVGVEYILAAGTFDEEMAVLLEDKMGQVNEFERTSVSLFLALVERLNEAPQNTDAKAAWSHREKAA